YRVQVNSDAETDVIVRDGEAEITTPQGSTRVKAGELIAIHGTDNPEYRVSDAPEKDDWDRWNKDRDNVIRDADGYRHTNRYYTGANDLDGYGRWVYVPGYGNVWQPYGQSVGWAPYQTGRWVWQPYYGWTWVSYEPWGWAPYHYGRWFYYNDSWCWWPGPVYVGYRPLWSPAFVFFVGFGHRAGFGFGSIGWFPVGPGDPFYPWYGRGFNRVNVVNITNITVINRGGGGFIAPLARRGRGPFFSNAHLALTNPRIRGSITSVSTENFGRGGNEGWRHGVDEHELRDGRVMTANLPVVPTHESLSAGRGNSASLPAGIQPRSGGRFYTQHQPPAGPESFHDQAARVQRVVGPQSVGGSTGAQNGSFRNDVHSLPAQVDRHDVGGAGGNGRSPISGKTGIAEVPRNGSSASGGPTSHGPSGSGGTAAQDSRSGDRGGWRSFGPPRSGGESGNTHVDQGTASRTRSGDQGGGQEGNWQRFPSASGQGARSNGNDTGTRGGNTGSFDRSGGSSKPPLELHRAVVTPRESDTHNSAPSPSRTPESSPSRGESPRYNPPSRNDSPRYNPPSHSSGGGGSGGGYSSRGDSGYSSRGGGGYSSRGGGGGSSRGGSGGGGGGGGSSHSSGGSGSHGSGGHSESKSSGHGR
ncbi:MAG TPA: DUF6600 domain-containing protein, partial [Candidatus Angelobacter sp.]|nr:DUF6600 domain-containing protein [Candidatus Angelobacter sp.]